MDLSGALPLIGTVLGVIVVLLVVFFALSRATRLYHRVPPSQVLVVFGRGKTSFDTSGAQDKTGVRFVTGGGTIVLPVLEECTTLDLTVMTISQSRDRVYSVDGVPINLDWVAQVKIAEDRASLSTAARSFLGKGPQQIVQIITETLSTNFRAIVGQMTVENVHRDRDAFVQKVQGLAADEMSAMGIRVISMGVKEINDDQGYFEAMAKPKIAEVKRIARVAEAEADRVSRESEAKEQLTARQAELSKEKAVTEGEEAVELQKVEKIKKIGLAQAASDMEVQKNKALAAAQQQEATVLVPARAEKEAIEIRATAARFKTETDAEASAKAAETSARGTANAAKLAAEATAQATRQTGQASADAEKAKLLATAEGTRATLLAEAEGKQKIAEATAAEGEVNLRQFVAGKLIEAQQAVGIAMATAMGQMGEKIKIVQIGDIPAENNGLLNMLQQAPRLAVTINEQVKALTGGTSIEQVLAQVMATLKTAGQTPASAAPETAVESTTTAKAAPKKSA